MFAFLFWLCVIGVPLLWAVTTIDRDADDPVGQLLRSVPKVLTQPHLLPVSLRDSEGARSGAGRSSRDAASAGGRREGASADDAPIDRDAEAARTGEGRRNAADSGDTGAVGAVTARANDADDGSATAEAGVDDRARKGRAPAVAGRVSEPVAGADRQASGESNAPSKDAPTEAASSSAEGTDERAGRRRPLFDAPAERDDLKRISGIGPVMERHLNELGVVSFAQLAAFSEEDVARVDAALEDFHGRIVRDNWVGQARAIVAGDEPA